ncbi:MAG: bifunctional riboflavin kinase/FMN adenylyltransferase [Kangiellaceae bacterium]|nr:bifunctional riboflavin kinase/FMN adenylyltransferase [Kangiellaceae bacterium]|tara:strand:+ start:914 stop:1846 length:933 start_codon:yes stop_codon:yes gene_type:complete
MRLIRGLYNITDADKGCAATIGNFDGVHLGHQAILERLTQKAQKLGVPSTVIVFEPQPREFFDPANAPPRLTRLHEKIRMLQRCGIDRVLCLRFNAAFSEQSPETFVENIILKGLGVRYLMVGDDFRFGRKRIGDFQLLERIGQQNGFEVERMGSFVLEQSRVSSTIIRKALAEGDLTASSAMLGRPYSLFGRVVHGDKRGRQIGFPTANIRLRRIALPVNGVYAVKVKMRDGECYNGVANIGIRPTVNGEKPLLETHLFDFSGNIYGETLEVELQHFIRQEQRFDSVEQLKNQIDQDVLAAQHVFSIIS